MIQMRLGAIRATKRPSALGGRGREPGSRGTPGSSAAVGAYSPAGARGVAALVASSCRRRRPSAIPTSTTRRAVAALSRLHTRGARSAQRDDGKAGRGSCNVLPYPRPDSIVSLSSARRLVA